MKGDAVALAELLDVEKKFDLAQVIAWTDSDGSSLESPPIFVCIDYGHLDCVTVLLDLGVDPNLRDENDYTPAQWAAWKGFVEILTLLIQRGASIDQQTLDLAQEEGGATAEVMDLIRNHMDPYAELEGDEDEIMMKACREGDVQKVATMLADGYDYSKWKVEDGKYQFFSPMNVAVKRGHIEIMQLFMEEGVQVELGSEEVENPVELPSTTEPITEDEFKEMAARMEAQMIAEASTEEQEEAEEAASS